MSTAHTPGAQAAVKASTGRLAVAWALVGVPLAIKSGLYVSGAAYGIFFVMVIAGLRDWLKSEIDKWQPVIRKAGVYAD